MQDFPDTRASLILSIRDPANARAWHAFSDLYRPVIYRMARRRGLQDADAQDLAQQVLLSVSQSINNWQLDPTRPRFRNWLSRVTHNAIIDVFRRTKPDAAKGGSDIIDALGQFATAESEIAFEFERSVFRQAATKIRGEFNDETWQAFWQTTVLDESIVHCAAALNRSVGAVYTARSRVMKRLREMVATLKD